MTSEHDQRSNVVFLGFGGCGVNMLESWQNMLPDDALCIAMDRDTKDLQRKKTFTHKIVLSNVKAVGSTVEYSKSVRAGG